MNWTCEGLKPVKALNNSPKYWVWIEPVRDWNNCLLRISMVVKSCVNWTCEGLKQEDEVRNQNYYVMCELNLWGIETKLMRFFFQRKLSVWIEPVRDWNTKYLPFWICTLSSVNWTCEGLKLTLFQSLKSLLFRVNWTCEGLKQSSTSVNDN